MARLTLLLLGQAQIKLDEEHIEVKPRKALALLIYLAVTGRRHARDTLATLLWPDSDQRRARHALRSRLSELNLILGSDWIEVGRESVGLRRGFALDVAEFQQCMANGNVDSQALITASALYRDDFLAGFSLPDCPTFDEWQFFQGEGLRQLFAAGLEKLVAVLSDRAEYAAAIPHARRRLALDSLHEPAHRQLMRLYAQTGQQAAATRQYERCRQILADELGVTPSPETVALYEELLASEVAGRAARPHPHHNLPTQTTRFVGREAELADIARLLLDQPDCRLLNLIGPGGIGKTRLALASASSIDDAFPDGVYYAPLAPDSGGKLLVPAIAEALNFAYCGPADHKVQLLDYLRRKQLLLVIDNFEYFLAETDLLGEILACAPAVNLLVTSRERLNLREEWGYQVQGLAFPPGDDEPSESLSEYSAVALFVQSARQVTARFAPSDVELAEIGHICRLLEGLPLGVELAAAWTHTLSCREIAVEIEGSLDFLTTPLQNLPLRHRSLRVVLEQSWNRLAPADQAVLARLSMFRGSFSREAAVTVAGATLPLLSTLVDRSLVSRSATGHYELHGLLRQFAQEKLTATPDAHKQTRHEYCCFYAALVYRYELENKRSLALAAGNLLNTLAEWPNISAAWYHVLAYSMTSLIWQFTTLLSQYYEFRGLTQEGEETMGLALRRMRAQAEQVHPIQLMRVLTHYSWFCLAFSRFDQARQHLEEALALSSTLDGEADAADIGLMFNFLAWVARLQEKPANADSYLQRSMQACQDADFPWGKWMCLALWGEIEYDTGNYLKARQFYEQALVLGEGAQFLSVNVLVFLGNTYSALGEYPTAVSYLRRALLLGQDLPLIAPLFTALIGIAALFGRRYQHVLALELLTIVLSHPQCSIVARHHARILLRELRTHVTDAEIEAAANNVRQGQLSNRQISPNFTVDAGFVRQLLALLDEAVP